MKKVAAGCLLGFMGLMALLFVVAFAPFVGDEPVNNITVTARIYSDAVFYASAQDENGRDVVLSEEAFAHVENVAAVSWIKNGEVKEITIK